MSDNNLEEFVGAVVALVVLAVRGVTHVQRLAVVHRRDDVPRGATVGHQVQRLEHARDVERFVIGGGAGRSETQPFGCHAHHGEDGDRVHLHAADAVGHGVRMIAAETVRHRQAIVEEADMELAGLEHAADVAIVVRGHEAGRGIRMPPGADEVGAVLGLQEGHESHLAHRLFLARGASASASFLPCGASVLPMVGADGKARQVPSGREILDRGEIVVDRIADRLNENVPVSRFV